MEQKHSTGIFLGTGASEMIPDPFCSCDVCNYARLHPKEQRVRSAFMLGANTCIDFGPDVLYSSARFGVDFSKIEDVLITHTHEDHFSPANLGVVSCNIPKPYNMFTVHMSEEGYNGLCATRRKLLETMDGSCDIFSAVDKKLYSVVPHKVYEKFRIGGMEIFPVFGFHNGNFEGEKAFNYRITENGRTLLYALDTGIYRPETLEALSGFPIDTLIMDATFGSKNTDSGCTHLDARSFILQLDSLIKAGIVTEKTKIYASHINHYNLWHHDEYQNYFNCNSPLPVTLAYDGLKIDI